MNDQTLELIRDLAEKLGTTTEHLWGVLVTQAYISGVGDVIFWTFFGFSAVFLHRKLKVFDPEDPDLQMIAKFVFWATLSVFLVVGVATMSDTIAKFFNPEYWALPGY